MSSTKKTLISLPGPHFVIYESPLPTAQVLARLDEALNRKEAEGIIKVVTQELKTQQELEEKIAGITKGGRDIMYMSSTPLHSLTTLRTSNPSPPLIINYLLGNPLYAQRIIKLNPLAGANIPPRLVVVEKEDGSGTRVGMHLWEAVMGDPYASGEEGEELRKELRALDEKFEKLVLGVLNAEES
ncbi:hypothetical protein BJ165DRAFT_1521432 [Panaeolus papilionaceus]|nr:hypothetical protein BJ165DRAFT_1521432 [Panaeolus papilionaceus]